jgi:hypothetical protein
VRGLMMSTSPSLTPTGPFGGSGAVGAGKRPAGAPDLRRRLGESRRPRSLSRAESGLGDGQERRRAGGGVGPLSRNPNGSLPNKCSVSEGELHVSHTVVVRRGPADRAEGSARFVETANLEECRDLKQFAGDGSTTATRLGYAPGRRRTWCRLPQRSERRGLVPAVLRRMDAGQAGIFAPLVRLQRQQRVWRFSGVLRPPLDTGTMWPHHPERGLTMPRSDPPLIGHTRS